jgi:peptidoglycan/LPS O-acetylase OafA/YrhL
MRRPEIDWLRVGAVLLLVPFHTARIFDIWDPFYAKNAELSAPLSYFVAVLNPWHMPLLFCLAGMSTWFALRQRGAGAYLRERAQRLLLPLLFGVAVVVPPQAYFGLLTHGGPAQSYLAFWPSFFNIRSEDMSGYFGSFTPGHLWFILFLFALSCLALPLFLRWRAPRYEINWLSSVCSWRGGLFLLGVPLALTDATPDLGGKNPAFYLLLFIYGYLLAASPRVERAVERNAWLALALGLGSMTLYLTRTTLLPPGVPEWFGGALAHLLRSLNTWFWVLALVGLGRRYLRAMPRGLQYASEASYPFYILHQTVIVMIGFYVVAWNAPIMLNFILIVGFSTVTSLSIYELLIRRLDILRALFGLRSRAGATGRRGVEPIHTTVRPSLG